MRSNKYIPGVCNINREEIKRREIIGKFSFAIAISYILITIFLKPEIIFILFIFVPIFGAVLNYIQVTEKFCAQYGMRGIQNIDEENSIKNVEDKYIFRDRIKSINIIFRSIIYSVIITLIYFLFYILIIKK